MQSSSLLTARLQRLNFYVVLRKLISQLQAFYQRIQKASMVRFYSSIDSDDVVLMRQATTREGVFHGTHPINRRRDLDEDRISRQRSRHREA